MSYTRPLYLIPFSRYFIFPRSVPEKVVLLFLDCIISDSSHSFLQLQHREYCVILVNQADKGMFNRAKLMNVGYDFAKNEHYFWNDKTHFIEYR